MDPEQRKFFEQQQQNRDDSDEDDPNFGPSSLGEKWLEPRAYIKVDDAIAFIEECKKQIDPKQLGVNITTLKDINNKTVIVGTSTEPELYKFCNDIKTKFDVEIVPAVVQDPIIVIYNTLNLTEDEITNTIENITGEPIARIETEYELLKNVYVTLSYFAYHELQEENPYEINFGNTKCFYEQHMPIPMCDNCSLFGHTALRCQAGGEEARAFRNFIRQQKGETSTSSANK